MTAPTSVRASQRGLPVSRAMSSAKSLSLARTTLAKRRTASIRKACECAAQAGQAARAAATSAAASPTLPDQTSFPVAGSKEISFAVTPGPSVTSDWSSTRRCILFYRFAHSADRLNLVVERLPVVALGDCRPYSFDFVDMHGAGLIVGPIVVAFGPLAAGQVAR